MENVIEFSVIVSNNDRRQKCLKIFADQHWNYCNSYFSICIKCGKNDLPTTSMMDAERIFARVLEKC